MVYCSTILIMLNLEQKLFTKNMLVFLRHHFSSDKYVLQRSICKILPRYAKYYRGMEDAIEEVEKGIVREGII